MHGYQIVEEPCSSRYAALDVVTDRHNDKVVEDPSCVHHYCCRPWMQRLDEAAAVGSAGVSTRVHVDLFIVTFVDDDASLNNLAS